MLYLATFNGVSRIIDEELVAEFERQGYEIEAIKNAEEKPAKEEAPKEEVAKKGRKKKEA